MRNNIQNFILVEGRSATLAITLWILKVLLAAFLVYAAINKLAGVERSVMFFQHIGLGQWFRYFTGIVELLASALLLIPSLSIAGALLLVCVSVGAVVTLLSFGLPPTPAVITLILSSLLVYLDLRLPRFKAANANSLGATHDGRG